MSDNPARPEARRYLIKPFADPHVEQSRRMILAAAELVPPERALVLGGGACEEIPLMELATRFRHVTINDLAREPLERALAACRLPDESAGRIALCVADLTGANASLGAAIEAAVAAAADPADAIERMAAVADETRPVTPEFAARFELIVASCLISQLHAPAIQQAERLFLARFGAEQKRLSESPRWVRAVEQLADRMEADFVAGLAHWLAPNGRLYFSETTHVCFTESADNGTWSSGGKWRMTRRAQLEDYFDAAWAVETRCQWNWVRAVPSDERKGRIFDVQGLVLRPSASANVSD